MEKEFVPYEIAFELKELGFDEPCMYAWCITPKHRVEYDGKMSLKTDGNPFGQFYKGKSFNGNYNPNKNRIQCSAPLYQQVFRWFREKHNLYACIERVEYIDSNEKGFQWYIFDKCSNVGEKLMSYEEAELECLKKLIKIVKDKS